MREIVDHLILTFGGPNRFAQKLYQSYVDGTVDHRRRIFETILAIDTALAEERAVEKQLLVEKLRSGGANADDVVNAREKLSTKQLLDACCEPVGVLVEAGLLSEVLHCLISRGQITTEQLVDLRRVVG